MIYHVLKNFIENNTNVVVIIYHMSYFVITFNDDYKKTFIL